nr:asparagine--tRNA ligase, chloroplastic/mitochondrial [Tanacetum cinerariifolium]
MDFFNNWIEKGIIDRLSDVVEKSFVRMTYTDAVELLLKSKKKFEFPVKWGCDLQSEHERYITEEAFNGCPVIITDYPKDIKAFYMRLNDDGKTVAAMDMLVPRVLIDTCFRVLDCKLKISRNMFWTLHPVGIQLFLVPPFPSALETTLRHLSSVSSAVSIDDIVETSKTDKIGEFKKRLWLADIKGGKSEGSDNLGQVLTVRGWVRTLRVQRTVTFIEVNDGSCLSNMQCVIDSDAEVYDQVVVRTSGSESRPPMLNKENYVPWSSRLLRYAKSRPNGKLIHNSILNRPYVRKMIPEPGDANREITVTKTFHLQTDDELSDKELKQIEADDQAIQTILLGLPKYIYAAVDSCETAQEIWLRVQQMMKGYDIGIQEKKAKLFNEWERFTSNEGESIESYYHRFLKLMNDLKGNKHFPEKIASNLMFLNNLQPEWTPHQDQSSFNQNYLKQPMPNPEDIKDLITAMNMTLALMAKAFKLNYSTPTNNNQRISSNPRNRQIAQPGMNMGQDRQMQMVGGNGGNQFRQYAGNPAGQMQMVGGNGRNQFRQYAGNPAGYNDAIGNQVIQNAVQNLRVQNIGIQNGLIGVQGNGNQNQIGNGNLVAARAEGNT